jgi:hypothetical protein
MARRPISEQPLASRGHLSPQEPKLPWSYPVLAHLSVGYPELRGRLPTCYSPVRRFTRGVAPPFSLDLHVLGTPPAFVLSQDQTLQLNLERLRDDEAVEGTRVHEALALVSTLIALSKSPRTGPFPLLVALEKGRYYLVFKDRVLPRADWGL